MVMAGEARGWSAEVRCTGAGNEGQGCGALLAVGRTDVFNSCTYARPIATVECHRCGAWTDLDAPLWPGHGDDLRPLVRRRWPEAPHPHP